jgi:hypothetical protein
MSNLIKSSIKFIPILILMGILAPLNLVNVSLVIPPPTSSRIHLKAIKAKYGIVRDKGSGSILIIGDREIEIPRRVAGAYTDIVIGNGKLNMTYIHQ